MQPSQFDPLQPEFREAAETLEQALTEACAAKAAREADTGELIKVEEMLALANEAAKRAIAIRRKAREQAAAAARGELLPREPAADQPGSPFHRFYDDKQGVRWDVWAVYPEARPSQLSALPGTFQSGWLVFESATEKRRLSPIPSDWQTIGQRDLEDLCDRAEVAPRRGRTRRGGAGEEAPPHTE